MTASVLTEAFADYARRLTEASEAIGAKAPHLDPIDVAEGHRLFLRYLGIGLDRFVEHSDPRFPAFYSASRDGVRKYAGDSPGQLYDTAPLSADHEYVVTGNLHGVELIELGIYSGDLSGRNNTPRRLIAHLTEAEIDTDADGNFRLSLGRGQGGTNHLHLAPDTSNLSVRRYLRDPLTDRPAPLRIQRIGADIVPPALTAEDLSSRLRLAGAFALTNLEMWADWTEKVMAAKPNTITPMADSGDIYTPAGHRYLDGSYDLPDPRSCLLIEFPAPPADSYWSLVPMNFWMESMEWRFGHEVFASSFSTVPGPDGVIRLAVGEEDPGLPHTTWLRTMGHRQGLVAFRFARLEGELPEVACRVVTR
ncbi:DUF1214 domain-containing protein [Nocardioides alcanivorans]|uniref:DUF1214 domain-containing protein n=1 Tax=Nocardioides alcanivorans TaxID=2897352 RepID=UPI001F455AB5|nr:DUF1214 domain-containing protein [Nocardioides alcanivorans]